MDLDLDLFRLCVALGPVAVYVLLLGGINLSRRPLLVTGVGDAATLGLAVAGFVVVGPIELFFPDAAAMRFGPYVWLLLLAFYGMCLLLVLLLLRPRLIVYNMVVDQFRPILADLAAQLDAQARWAGDSLALPNLGVQLHVDHVALMRNVSLVSAGPHQNHAGWRRLEQALEAALGREEVARNPRGVSLLGFGVLIVALLVLAVARDPESLAQSLFEMLRLSQ